MSAQVSIFTTLLKCLGVPYTGDYSEARFQALSFRTLFGLRSLLKEYRVESTGVRLTDEEEIDRLPLPFIARIDHRMVVVTSVSGDRVSYMSAGVQESVCRELFLRSWDGMAFLVRKLPGAAEPDLRSHRLKDAMRRLRDVGLWVAPLFLLVWLSVSRELVDNVWTILLLLLNIVGLVLSFMLLQKTLGVRNKAADHVCGILEAGGCDRIAKSDGATFLGVFHWSEVGMTFFSVNLLTMLLFPSLIPELAMFDICALPYTVWSITYQKFKARTWCTMCVGVQLTLWALFVVYLAGGYVAGILPLRLSLVPIAVAYVAVMLALNKLDEFIMSYGKDTDS